MFKDLSKIAPLPLFRDIICDFAYWRIKTRTRAFYNSFNLIIQDTVDTGVTCGHATYNDTLNLKQQLLVYEYFLVPQFKFMLFSILIV
jgi:hypothetical protein